MSRSASSLREPLDLDLADALAGQVHDRADLFERRPAAVGDVERAGLGHLPDLEVGEVQLDGAGPRRHVEVEVVLARDERARALAAGALRARHAGCSIVVDLGVEHAAELELALGHALDADRARADGALAARPPLLARDRRRLRLTGLQRQCAFGRHERVPSSGSSASDRRSGLRVHVGSSRRIADSHSRRAASRTAQRLTRDPRYLLHPRVRLRPGPKPARAAHASRTREGRAAFHAMPRQPPHYRLNRFARYSRRKIAVNPSSGFFLSFSIMELVSRG